MILIIAHHLEAMDRRDESCGIHNNAVSQLTFSLFVRRSPLCQAKHVHQWHITPGGECSRVDCSHTSHSSWSYQWRRRRWRPNVLFAGTQEREGPHTHLIMRVGAVLAELKEEDLVCSKERLCEPFLLWQPNLLGEEKKKKGGGAHGNRRSHHGHGPLATQKHSSSSLGMWPKRLSCSLLL